MFFKLDASGGADYEGSVIGVGKESIKPWATRHHMTSISKKLLT